MFWFMWLGILVVGMYLGHRNHNKKWGYANGMDGTGNGAMVVFACFAISVTIGLCISGIDNLYEDKNTREYDIVTLNEASAIVDMDTEGHVVCRVAYRNSYSFICSQNLTIHEGVTINEGGSNTPKYIEQTYKFKNPMLQLFIPCMADTTYEVSAPAGSIEYALPKN